MDPRGPTPQPAQKPEKHGRVRRRKTRRERNKALVGSHRSLSRQDPVLSSREQSVVLQDPMASKAPKLVVITQGRLSREHRGLFNHEVKSLDVTRLLNSGSLDPGSPVLSTRASHSPSRVQEPASQSRGKENQVMHGGSGPDPSSPPEPPVLGQLLEDFQSQLILPQAFPRRNLVQEARDAVVGTLQACHGCLPDLCLVLRAFQPLLPETKSRVQGRLRMAPSWVTSPEPVPGEGKQTPQETPELPFALMNTSSTSPAHRGGLVPPMGPRPPLLPSLPSPSGTTWGPPTAFDLLKSIWLIATPPPSQPWDVFPPQAPPQPLSPLLSRTAALDWSPSSPAPLPSLSWMVAQNSPEAWSFPPMRLY